MAEEYDIAFELEDHGRWIAGTAELPGVLAYGASQAEARSKVESLASELNSEREVGE
jgi:predicted RNase H-like HicB family nuclease